MCKCANMQICKIHLNGNGFKIRRVSHLQIPALILFYIDETDTKPAYSIKSFFWMPCYYFHSPKWDLHYV